MQCNNTVWCYSHCYSIPLYRNILLAESGMLNLLCLHWRQRRPIVTTDVLFILIPLSHQDLHSLLSGNYRDRIDSQSITVSGNLTQGKKSQLFESMQKNSVCELLLHEAKARPAVDQMTSENGHTVNNANESFSLRNSIIYLTTCKAVWFQRHMSVRR